MSVPKSKRGEMTPADVAASWQSWRSYALHFDAHRTAQAMGALYNSLFFNGMEEVYEQY